MVENSGTQTLDKGGELESWLEKIRFLSDAMEATSQPFCAANRDGTILIFNEAYCRLTGYSREELYELNWVTDLTVPESFEKEAKALDTVDRTHQSQRYEKAYRRKDGKVISIELLVELAADSAGRPLFYYAFITDITERKREEELLRLTQFAVDHFTESTIWLDPGGRIVYVNDATCKSTGYDRTELLSMHIWDIDPEFSPERYPLEWRKWEELSRLQVQNRFESVHRTRGGKVFPVEINAHLFAFRGRKYCVSFDMDITERKQAEEALRESEEKFRVLADTSSAVIYLYQGENLIYVNDAAEKITGYSRAELLKMRFWDIIDPAFRELVRDRGLARQRGEPVQSRYEVKLITKSGGEKWTEITAGRIEYAGKPAGVATFFDITERRKAEEALRETEEKFRQMAENIEEVFFIVTPDWGKTIYVSPGYERVWGRPPAEVYQNPRIWLETVYPEDRELPLALVQKHVSGQISGTDTVEFRIRKPDGAVRWIQGRTYPVRDERGRVWRITGIAEDITERRKAEEELKTAKAQAELYLDLMGHDINNMDQIALGYLEMARGMSTEASQAEILDKTIKVLRRSTQLISNVRKLRQLKEGLLPSQVVDVCEVLSELQREFGAVPNKTITLDLSRCGHCYTRANVLLQDVFANLVSNAIKHTGDRADITIGLDLSEERGSRYCRISVEDNGPGIPDELKPRIFNRMLKGETKAKGMGLGLYLVKTLVDSYSGRVWVEDRVPGDRSKGARFVVLLPTAHK